MSLFLALLMSVSFGMHAPTSRAPAPQDEDLDGNALVRCTVHADRSAIRPGSTFTLGVHFKIEPKWHVYWENPGDSGLATKAEVHAPAGFEVGPPRFPWPKRDVATGDIVMYVHEDEVMLLYDVRVPATAKPDSEVTFGVEGKWLVCKEICLPGSGKSSLALKVSAEEVVAEKPLFDTWRAKLPKPWGELTRSAATWSGEEGAPTLKIVVPGATALEFFPARDKTTELTSRKLESGKQGSTLTLSYSFSRKAPEDAPVARGVLWVKTEKGESSYRLDSTFGKK